MEMVTREHLQVSDSAAAAAAAPLVVVVHCNSNARHIHPVQDALRRKQHELGDA